MLAYKSKSFVEMVLAEHGMAELTPKTIISAEKLYPELEQIKNQGYAVDDEEVVLGVRCFAVPIFSYNGQVNHSIGVSGPKEHMTQSRTREYVSKMMKYGNQISEELGYGKFNI